MARALSADAKPVVLVVDDDRDVLSAISFALATEGFEVAGFARAESALSARPPGVSCMIVDHNLPGRTGLDLVDRLRADGLAAPAVLMTTAPSAALRRSADTRGVEILEKPLLGDVVSSTVRRLIEPA